MMEIRTRWSEHLQIMDHTRIPKGKGETGRPRKRWTAKTGTGRFPMT
jgi:hypothetical protein